MARLLGRESVSSDVAALFELVKNSYDGDATQVTITFENFDGNAKDGKIIVEDDGTAMTLAEIKKNWMVVGTYSKDEHFITKKKRRFVGNKGIGRFSTEKLAKNIVVISRPKSGTEEITINIDWRKYEKKNVNFNDVEHEADYITNRNNLKKHGLKIILTELRGEWNAEKIISLRSSISSLVIPSPLTHINNDLFNVDVIAKDFKIGKDEKVHSLLFKYAPFKLTATIPENRTDFRVKLFKKGILVGDEYVELKDEELPDHSSWKSYGKCKLVLYFYPGQTTHEPWNKYYKTYLKISKIQGVLADIHGVKLYRDNFWVRPYGDLGNDWLDLDKKRVMSNLNVGNTQVIGFVQITSDDNPGIIDTTTRERLVENREFHSLVKFTSKAIDVLSDFRLEENRKFRENKGKLEHKNIIEVESKFLEELIDSSDIAVKDKKVMRESVKIITKTFQDYTGEVSEDIKSLSLRERAFRNLVTLGISSATTSHEIANVLAVLSEIPKSLSIKMCKTPIPQSSIFKDIDDADSNIKSIKQFMLFIRHFVMSLKDDFEGEQKKERITLSPMVNKLLKRFSAILQTKEIDIKLNIVPSDTVVYMNKADLQSIIVNFLTNSLKAFNKLPSDKKRKIKISMLKDTRNFKFRFSDNGPGIAESNREKVFRLFVSSYKDGTGLGLAIIKEIVEEYGGTVEVKAISELNNGATIEISIPLEGLRK